MTAGVRPNIRPGFVDGDGKCRFLLQERRKRIVFVTRERTMYYQ